jgi:Phospholipase_D-nuclease N-terminal
MFSSLGPMETLIILMPIFLWLFPLIDVLRNEFNGNNKLIWFLVIMLIPFLGGIFYLLIGRAQKIPKES